MTKKSFTLSSDNVSFKPLIYFFKETVEYDVKASFARRRVSCLIKPDDIIKVLREDDKFPWGFSWMENYKVVYFLKYIFMGNAWILILNQTSILVFVE